MEYGYISVYGYTLKGQKKFPYLFWLLIKLYFDLLLIVVWEFRRPGILVLINDTDWELVVSLLSSRICLFVSFALITILKIVANKCIRQVLLSILLHCDLD